jgi:hypothetical protein
VSDIGDSSRFLGAVLGTVFRDVDAELTFMNTEFISSTGAGAGGGN